MKRTKTQTRQAPLSLSAMLTKVTPWLRSLLDARLVGSSTTPEACIVALAPHDGWFRFTPLLDAVRDRFPDATCHVGIPGETLICVGPALAIAYVRAGARIEVRAARPGRLAA